LPQEIAAQKSSNIGLSFLSGLLVTLGNPKTMLFYVALVPTLIDINSIGPREYGILLVTTFVVLLVVLVPYMMLASRARDAGRVKKSSDKL
jgi:threonine/homoserine/homoserine lactone efflux protein